MNHSAEFPGAPKDHQYANADNKRQMPAGRGIGCEEDGWGKTEYPTMGRFGEGRCYEGTHSTRREVEIRSHGISGSGKLRADADSGRDPFSVNISCRLRGSQGSGSQKYEFQLDSFVVVSDG